jgi:hypothetical protein
MLWTWRMGRNFRCLVSRPGGPWALPWMSRADRFAWRQARTLADLGQLTAAWLEGELASQPGYAPNFGPDEETAPLVPLLAALNRAGLLTDQSQPGWGPGLGYDGATWCQRAAVVLYADRPGLATLARLIRSVPADQLVITSHGSAVPGGLANGVTVTEREGQPVTGFGHRLTDTALSTRWDTITDTAWNAVADAWQVTLIDPEWGRNSVLWPALADLLGVAAPQIEDHPVS